MQVRWTLASSHGLIFFYILLHPDCTIKEIAQALCLTRRTVWGTIGHLRRTGIEGKNPLIKIRKSGRTHYYQVDERFATLSITDLAKEMQTTYLSSK